MIGYLEQKGFRDNGLNSQNQLQLWENFEEYVKKYTWDLILLCLGCQAF